MVCIRFGSVLICKGLVKKVSYSIFVSNRQSIW